MPSHKSKIPVPAMLMVTRRPPASWPTAMASPAVVETAADDEQRCVDGAIAGHDQLEGSRGGVQRLVDRGQGDVDDEVIGLRPEHADEQNHDPDRTQVLDGLRAGVAVDGGAHGIDGRQQRT